MTKILSKCHDAEVGIGGREDSTRWHICTFCLNQCQVYQKEDWKEENMNCEICNQPKTRIRGGEMKCFRCSHRNNCLDCREGIPCYGDNWACECECTSQKRPKCSKGVNTVCLEHNKITYECDECPKEETEIVEKIKALRLFAEHSTFSREGFKHGYIQAIDGVLALFKKSKE